MSSPQAGFFTSLPHVVLGQVRVQSASRYGMTVITDTEELLEKWRRVKTSADKRAIKEVLESDDPDIRAEAEEHAQLDEASRYAQPLPKIEKPGAVWATPGRQDHLLTQNESVIMTGTTKGES